ncbi:MAG TPA: prolyl oligopeptidase family serine peptidase [Stellaceae bacterium]|nr:prolyl oligopeptidase family serine peptidase [Stellaceae bacterium]
MDELAFTYFPGEYRWSAGMMLALSAAPWGGAEIGEVHRVGLALKDKIGDDDAWFREWAAMADTLERKGRALLAAGHGFGAASYLFRAANYAHVGERFLHPKSAGADAYRRGVQCFKDAARLIDRPRIESVEVPYEGKSLPALLVHAAPERVRGGRAPAMVFFDGFDITKEIQYFKGVPDLAARGVACLIVDGPGNGESIRFRNLPLHHETERYARPAYEYLAGRPEFDPARIGVMAVSLGGYYAPRAAALEPRFACCIAWGAIWDYWQVWKDRLDRIARNEALSLSVPWQHLLWVFDVKTKEEALQRLEGFRLEGVAQRIKCPFLLMHGEGDAQIPLALARRCYEAVGSERKELKIFTRAEGGYHHCQSDNVSIGTAYMWDWCADVLRAGQA